MLLEVLDSRHQRPRDPVLRDGKSCPSWKFMILKVELHPIRAGRLTLSDKTDPEGRVRVAFYKWTWKERFYLC